MLLRNLLSLLFTTPIVLAAGSGTAFSVTEPPSAAASLREILEYPQVRFFFLAQAAQKNPESLVYFSKVSGQSVESIQSLTKEVEKNRQWYKTHQVWLENQDVFVDGKKTGIRLKYTDSSVLVNWGSRSWKYDSNAPLDKNMETLKSFFLRKPGNSAAIFDVILPDGHAQTAADVMAGNLTTGKYEPPDEQTGAYAAGYFAPHVLLARFIGRALQKGTNLPGVKSISPLALVASTAMVIGAKTEAERTTFVNTICNSRKELLEERVHCRATDPNDQKSDLQLSPALQKPGAAWSIIASQKQNAILARPVGRKIRSLSADEYQKFLAACNSVGGDGTSIGELFKKMGDSPDAFFAECNGIGESSRGGDNKPRVQ